MADQIIEKDLHEVPANQRILDVRPWSVKATEWISFKDNFTLVVFVCVVTALVFPLTTPIAGVALLVVTFVNRSIRAVMPLRYPAGSFDKVADKAGKETRPVPGTDKEADGILMLGNLESSSIAARGRELWLADDDLRKHLLILGATGSGKSETLKAICYNALCWSSGFFIADGKADNKLATDVYTLSRRFGVDDNLLCLNFLLGGNTPQQVANARRRRSNSLNPFRTSDEDTVIQMGANLMPKVEGEGKQWQEKALAVWRAQVKALCYKRDHDGFELSIDVFLEYLALDKIEELYIEGYDRRDQETLEWPYGFLGIKGYLESGLPGYSVDKLLRKFNRVAAPPAAGMGMAAPGRGGAANNDQAPAAFEQHSYRSNQLQPALGLLAYTYGHIFKHRYPEIDIVDVVLNDRILLTLIPPLEKSSQEAENLGKLAIACLRVMMARNLGTEIEGSREELIDSKATAAAYPYVVALDELGYYFADGIAVMFAQARSLGFMMIALAQDLEKLTEGSRAAEAGAMMGNQVSKLFMRIDDAQKTWNLIKEVLGKVPVAVVRAFKRRGGAWERSEEASIEMVEPVTLQQFQAMDAGEGILSSRGQRLHFRSLYVGEALKKNNYFRLNRFLQVRPPSQEAIDQYSDPLDVTADPVEKGRRMMEIMRGETSVEYRAEPDSVLAAMSQTAGKLPKDMSAEERGVVLYMAARDAILKARSAVHDKDPAERPEDAAIDVSAIAAEGQELPFARKDAQPIVALLQGEVDASEKQAGKPRDPLEALGLIPGMGDGAVAGSATVEPDESPEVWSGLPFKRRSRDDAPTSPEESKPQQPTVATARTETGDAGKQSADAAPQNAGRVTAEPHIPPPLPLPLPSPVSEGIPSFEPAAGDKDSGGFDGIAGFDIVPSPRASEALDGCGAFAVSARNPSPPQAMPRMSEVQPSPAPETSSLAPAGTGPVSDVPPVPKPTTVERAPADAEREPNNGAWNATMGRAFIRLLALDDEEERSGGPVEVGRDIPVDESGRVDIPVDEQGLMIGMSDQIADRVRTLDELMGQPSTEVSMAALEAEIAIQVTPPVADVSDDAGEQLSEEDIGRYFKDLEASLKE